MPQYVPKYVKPSELDASRARMRRRLVGIAFAIPLAFVVMAFGYSDQAPDFLRNAIITIDRALGYPIMGLLSKILG